MDTSVFYRSEIEYFETAIRSLGFSTSDFGLRCVQWPRRAKAGAAADLVIVRRHSLGIEKAYPAATESSWVMAFFHDLYAGAFGAPPERAGRGEARPPEDRLPR